MVFSAMALVVFTATSFAGESITKKSETSVDVEILNSIKQDVLKSDTPCADAWNGAYDAQRDLGKSHDYADAYADAIFSNCMKKTYGINAAL